MKWFLNLFEALGLTFGAPRSFCFGALGGVGADAGAVGPGQDDLRKLLEAAGLKVHQLEVHTRTITNHLEGKVMHRRWIQAKATRPGVSEASTHCSAATALMSSAASSLPRPATAAHATPAASTSGAMPALANEKRSRTATAGHAGQSTASACTGAMLANEKRSRTATSEGAGQSTASALGALSRCSADHNDQPAAQCIAHSRELVSGDVQTILNDDCSWIEGQSLIHSRAPASDIEPKPVNDYHSCSEARCVVCSRRQGHQGSSLHPNGSSRFSETAARTISPESHKATALESTLPEWEDEGQEGMGLGDLFGQPVLEVGTLRFCST